MKILLTLFLSLLCASALAQNHVTASITVTNLTTNGMTFAVNGNTRTFTNNVVLSSVQVLTNADATGCGSKTNLLNQIALNNFSLVSPPSDTGSNTFSLTAVSVNPLVVTVSAGYASVSYSTQTVSSTVAVRIPTTAESAAQQTNIDSGLVAAINNAANTNALNQNATVANQLLGTTNTQTVSGQKTLSNTNNHIFGIVSSLGISGYSVMMSNGLYWTPILTSPITSNLVNYGNAISSPGTNGTLSEQFGAGAIARGEVSFAAGAGAIANGQGSVSVGDISLNNGDDSTAVGHAANASADSSLAIGDGATSSGVFSVAVGASATASALASTAIGQGSSATFQNSTALGTGSATTTSNQVMIGSPGSSAVVPNNLNVGTNATVGGNAVIGGNVSIAGIQTNAFVTGSITASNADIAFIRKSVSSLANGVNSDIPIGTNTFIEVSTPTLAFSINGIANGRDGKWIAVLNQTGQAMTVANESGVDSTAANRIRTGFGNDLVLNGNSITYFWYNAFVSRWIYGGSSAQVVLASLTTITNPIVDGGYWTNTTGQAGILTVNIHTAVNGSSNPSMCLTNFGNGEWLNVTNDSAGGTIDLYFKTVFRVAPGDYIEATNHGAASSTALVQASWFRP